MRALLVATLLCTGCAGSLEEAHRAGHPVRFAAVAEPSEHCQGLDRDRSLWTAVAAGAGVLAGGAGLTTIPVKDDDGRVALVVSGVAATALAATALALETSATEAWVRDCGPSTGGAAK